MIVSVHIAEVGPRAAAEVLLRQPKPGRVPGLTYAETTANAPLGEPLLPPRRLGPVGMIAAWESDEALDEFSRSHPAGRHLAGGWEVRLQPLRVAGAWAGMPGLPSRPLAVDDEEPVGILTLGRLRLLRTGAFRRSAGPAEAAALDSPALLAGTGLARPPPPRRHLHPLAQRRRDAQLRLRQRPPPPGRDRRRPRPPLPPRIRLRPLPPLRLAGNMAR